MIEYVVVHCRLSFTPPLKVCATPNYFLFRMEMDQDTAQTLFNQGAVLLLLDVPPRTEIGIDMHSWIAASKFKGIKMIPPGLHFIYFR